MRIVVTANEADLDAPASPVFGRCPTYVFVDTETMTFEAVENPAINAAGGGWHPGGPVRRRAWGGGGRHRQCRPQRLQRLPIRRCARLPLRRRNGAPGGGGLQSGQVVHH